jgi:hypothetical protein
MINLLSFEDSENGVYKPYTRSYSLLPYCFITTGSPSSLTITYLGTIVIIVVLLNGVGAD